MTRNEVKRRRWHARGVDAIARATEGAVGGYVCPMCATVCDFIDLTLEDAPPKAVGGKPVALTCWDCNNGAHAMDAEMRRAEDLLDWRAGTSRSPIRARLAIRGGAPVTVETQRRDGGAFAFAGLPRSNDPAVFARFQTDLEELVTRPREEQALDVTFHTHRFAPANVRAGWLRAAYLIAFARFGYRYALRPLMARVREQIADP
jgi:hypothetical protein